MGAVHCTHVVVPKLIPFDICIAYFNGILVSALDVYLCLFSILSVYLINFCV